MQGGTGPSQLAGGGQGRAFVPEEGACVRGRKRYVCSVLLYVYVWYICMYVHACMECVCICVMYM